MIQLAANIGFDTAENGPSKVWLTCLSPLPAGEITNGGYGPEQILRWILIFLTRRDGNTLVDGS